MFIERLELVNFCCFEQAQFDYAPGFNLLVGDNGSGKSSILDGLAVGLGLFVSNVDPSFAHRHNPAQVRQARFEHEGVPDVQPQFPCSVSITTKLGSNSEIWHGEADRPGGWTSFVTDHGLVVGERVRSGEPVMLPVIRYFGGHRNWIVRRQLDDASVAKRNNRLAGYQDSLDPGAAHRHLEDWMKWQTGVAAQRGRPLPQLGAVEAAVKRCIPAVSRFYFDILNDELRLEFEDGRLIPFGLLSMGYRGLVALVAEIAWRAAALNPQFGADAPAQAEGVILIDELDLHLHPKWQRQIIGDLCAAFPKLQFIATTHSPFVIQALENGNLIDLSEPKGASWRNKSIEDIAEEIQGVENPQRSQRFQDMIKVAERYYQLLAEVQDANDEQLAQLRGELDALMIPFADDPAYVAMLKMERVAAEAERNQ